MPMSFKDLEMLKRSSPTGGVLGSLDDDAYDDDILLHTHPADMSEPMLQAVQARINQSPEFAARYRESTDYKPLPTVRRPDPATGTFILRKIKGVNF
jgi:hypothetical protein